MEVLPVENWADTGPTCKGLFRLALFPLRRIDRLVRRTRSNTLYSNLALLLTPLVEVLQSLTALLLFFANSPHLARRIIAVEQGKTDGRFDSC